ncbi:AAA family ATPase [Candidatus Leptofilum sp.]|uniref:AAA family ATPase n=1 Tax=Candidatus Leptofilum sp. TaxID=3241576 RepID=UPI003B5C8FAB
MQFTKFRIKNFKGIKNTELRLDKTDGRIFTLVGLNECGKTTVLEAINSFSPDLEAEPIFQSDVFRKVEHRDLVPKHRKDNFTGNVEIEAHFKLSDRDIQSLHDYLLKEYEVQLNLDLLGSTFSVTKVFKFEQSDFIKKQTLWNISLFVKTRRAKRYKSLLDEDPAWQDAVGHLQTRIPSICYFPTFLFEFPLRVYLSHTPEQYEPQNAYYRQIIQDVLDSLDRGLTIEEHIVERVERIDDGKPWDFFSFWKSDRKEQVDAVMSHLGNAITKNVFTRWNEIFGSRFSKNINIEWNVDSAKPNPPIYLSFSIQDGTSTYSIAERSLGFRWFFCFLLFTQFRKSRKGSGTLFLLDEPASNLHATAQKQLLASFDSVTEGNNSLIYSTHSHYMINPKWLEGAFIVQNGAIEYEKELSGMHEYEFHETDIKVSLYRQFVGENPDKSTYYQPILDALDYIPSVLEHQSHTVMVEGKGDYYIFSYFKEVVFEDDSNLRFLPSSGANRLGPLISLYLGWGYSFRILLDDDKAGREAKEKYMSEWYLDSSNVSTISDHHNTLNGKKLENLVSKQGKKIIKDELNLQRLTKKRLIRYFQDKHALNQKVKFDDATENNFKKVIESLHNCFENSAE